MHDMDESQKKPGTKPKKSHRKKYTLHATIYTEFKNAVRRSQSDGDPQGGRRGLRGWKVFWAAVQL